MGGSKFLCAVLIAIGLGFVTCSTGLAAVTKTGSIWDGGTTSSEIDIGFLGVGTLGIDAGSTLTRYSGYLGCNTGCTGTATVSGTGSTWTNSILLNVGCNGNGILNIEAGGQVSNISANLGCYPGSTGTAIVTGAGSMWTNSVSLDVGNYGCSGKLTVADGGKITATSLFVYDTLSMVRLNVSGNGMIVLGNSRTLGNIANDGTVAFYANAFLAKGTYMPISVYGGQWSGSGSYKAIGGVWSSSAKTFTVADPTTATAGVFTGVSTGQRLVITDSTSHKHVGASFGSVTGSPTFSASLMNSSELAALSQTTGFAGSVLSGWDFNTNLTGTEAMLAFDIGTGAGDVAVWHYSGGAWSPFTGDMQTYDANGILSFTATDFAGGYAVTATPEPATLAMLAIGGLAFIRRRRR